MCVCADGIMANGERCGWCDGCGWCEGGVKCGVGVTDSPETVCE